MDGYDLYYNPDCKMAQVHLKKVRFGIVSGVKRVYFLTQHPNT